ncbi:hypothetical protein OG921_24010 [Aldersonia sp. NBC_00410]|uniref:hypothetical protein n=1 Tax=Aldersonia sp. NBC_00410 TaxID=2975954 RepID=UPI00224F0346|nr:hypothetical protein [Aldersonia sp. NBC_00410]MCX5046241.1 hypothetical protein [Aldersonia sp. NBC_00410]
MGLFTDDKGRPELVVHPDIILGGTHFRPVEDPLVSDDDVDENGSSAVKKKAGGPAARKR